MDELLRFEVGQGGRQLIRVEQECRQLQPVLIVQLKKVENSLIWNTTYNLEKFNLNLFSNLVGGVGRGLGVCVLGRRCMIKGDAMS